jgi:hypothetical protein
MQPIAQLDNRALEAYPTESASIFPILDRGWCTHRHLNNVSLVEGRALCLSRPRCGYAGLNDSPVVSP